MHYNNMGVLFLEIGEFQLAVDFFGEAISPDPGSALHHSNLGMAYREMGQFNRANRCFEKAVDLSGKEVEDSMAGMDT